MFSMQLSHRCILQPKTMHKLVQIVGDRHLVRGGVQQALHIGSQLTERSQNTFADLVQIWHRLLDLGEQNRCKQNNNHL